MNKAKDTQMPVNLQNESYTFNFHRVNQREETSSLLYNNSNGLLKEHFCTKKTAHRNLKVW